MNTQTTVRAVDLEKFLVRASAIIKALGYVSNSEVKGTDRQSTAMLAFEWADDNRPNEIKHLAFDYTDKVTGKEVAEWLNSLFDEKIANATEYMQTLAAIGHVKIVNEKMMGYAASAIKAFEKEKNKGTEEKNSLQDMMAALGNPGTKLQGIQVKFVAKSQFDSRFGICHKYQFEDGAGHKITWMTSTEFTHLVQGTVYTLEGTIKEYSTYKSRHECQVTRAKVK